MKVATHGINIVATQIENTRSRPGQRTRAKE